MYSQIQGIIQIYKVQASFKVNLSNHFNWLKSDGVSVFIKIWFEIIGKNFTV
jgi:hypothetical protein